MEDSTFQVLIAEQANLFATLNSLAAGTCAAVIWPKLFASEFSDAMPALTQASFETYDVERLYPPIMKIGPAVYDYYTKAAVDDSYWRQAHYAGVVLTRIFNGADPVALILEKLRRGLGISVSPATIRGRPLHVGILREFRSTSKIHYDEIVREYPGGLDVEPIVQLAFNLHLAASDDGNVLTVWKHRWVPCDDRLKDGYGWHPDLMHQIPSATVYAHAGDAVWFDSRNFHQVASCSLSRRITLSFFCGFTMAGELIVWS
jgi:hypothetical protein